MSAGAIYAGRVTGPFLFGRIDRSHPLRKTIPKQRFVSADVGLWPGICYRPRTGKKNNKVSPLIDKQWWLRTILPPPSTSFQFILLIKETLPGFPTNFIKYNLGETIETRENWKIFHRIRNFENRVRVLAFDASEGRGEERREGGGKGSLAHTLSDDKFT